MKGFLSPFGSLDLSGPQSPYLYNLDKEIDVLWPNRNDSKFLYQFSLVLIISFFSRLSPNRQIPGVSMVESGGQLQSPFTNRKGSWNPFKEVLSWPNSPFTFSIK